jgi:hypothetical protein
VQVLREDALLRRHLNDRTKYFRKFEPRDGLRDTIPMIPQRNASVRIAQIWQTVLGPQDGCDAMEMIEMLAQAAIEENISVPTKDLWLDTGVASLYKPAAAAELGFQQPGDFVMAEDL